MKMRQGFVSNSSSSSFFIEQNVSVRDVEIFLDKALDLYNNIKRGRQEKDLKIDDICYVYEATRNDIADAEKRFKTNSTIRFTKVIVSSVDDNSIPYIILQLLQEKYKGTNYHGG